MKILLAIVGVVLSGSVADAEVPAFPGAEGFGALAAGGRGGEVVHVTNLKDSGPGSLREAVSRGKRIVVFDVGGYVELKSILKVESDLTIAGQSAPGEGIGTRGHEVSFSGSSNVICRYIRFRQGLAEKEDKKAAVGMHDAHRIILDHVSIQWGRWDTVDMTDASEVTIQYCIIGPGVAPQRFGCLCQSDDVTFSHNLWISNASRNPKSKGKVQYINNVVYNWGKVGFVGGHSAGEHFVDVVGNYFIKGPSSSDAFAGEFAETDKVYQAGNVLCAGRTGKLEGRELAGKDFRGATVVGKPWSTLTQVDTAEEAYQKVAAGAGCSLRRDAVDKRLIADLMSLGRRGSVVSDPSEMGGFGRIEGGVAAKDSDGDGIPDEWEVAHGMVPRNSKDGNRVDGSGYTMVEVYLNGLVGK
jgi:pectate lyase